MPWLLRLWSLLSLYPFAKLVILSSVDSLSLLQVAPVSVAKLGLDAPEACKPCLAQAEAALPEPLKPVAETVGGVKDVINTGLGTVFEGVKDQISGFTSLFGRQDTCDFVECGLALAPTGVSCVSAGAELGGNPFADSGCAISVVKLGLNTPDICKACLAQAEAALPEPLKPVAETVGGLKDVINTGLGTVFEGVKDQFSGLTHLFGREENLT
ncbi:hypothetical protein DL96DRAFT_1557684 [Flagelloscypha sp. PMI_526]|nr:hypothetical protein DL96DRAFT_1557684 [Flagelloscypha sp. PMI_526]